MSRKAKLTDEQRIRAVEEYTKDESNCQNISKKYGIRHETLLEYVRRFQIEGIDGLLSSRKNKKYSRETKLAAVKEYLARKRSLSKYAKSTK